MALLECRLDNIVHRLGFGQSRAQARQMIRHGHITVNGRRVDIPSYQVRVGDVIRVKNRAKSLDLVRGALAEAQPRRSRFSVAQRFPNSGRHRQPLARGRRRFDSGPDPIDRRALLAISCSRSYVVVSRSECSRLERPQLTYSPTHQLVVAQPFP